MTTLTLNRRTSSFRNLVVAFVLVGLASLVWALVVGIWQPLLGLFLLPTLFLLFAWHDRLLVGSWRRRILDLADHDALDLEVFLRTIVQIRTLPPGTLKGMLSTLSPANRTSPGSV